MKLEEELVEIEKYIAYAYGNIVQWEYPDTVYNKEWRDGIRETLRLRNIKAEELRKQIEKARKELLG